MTQIINHDLGFKFFHNPCYDFDLGYKNESEICYLCRLCIRGEELFLLCTTYTSNKINTRLIKKIKIYFYSLGQNHNLGYEQFYNLGYDL